MTREEVHREIEATRARMSSTIDELDQHITSRIESARDTVDPRTHVRAHPWPALFAALGAGIAIGATNADRKAAHAAVEGAKQAPGALADAGKATASGAVSLARSAAERLRSDDEDGADENPGSSSDDDPGFFGQLKASIRRAVEREVDVLGAELQRAANDLVDTTARKLGGR